MYDVKKGQGKGELEGGRAGWRVDWISRQQSSCLPWENHPILASEAQSERGYTYEKQISILD
jgi:hypothetical protein